MAKKVIAKLKDKTGKNMTKLIRTVKSERSGAYCFKEEILDLETAKKLIENQKA